MVHVLPQSDDQRCSTQPAVCFQHCCLIKPAIICCIGVLAGPSIHCVSSPVLYGLPLSLCSPVTAADGSRRLARALSRVDFPEPLGPYGGAQQQNRLVLVRQCSVGLTAAGSFGLYDSGCVACLCHVLSAADHAGQSMHALVHATAT